jgi:PAS domain S-box-containing protein
VNLRTEENFIKKIFSAKDDEQKKLFDFLEVLFNQTNDWVYLINQKRELVFISSNCKEVTGYSDSEFYNNNALIIDIVHESDRTFITKALKSEISKLPQKSLEFRIITGKGKEKWIEQKNVPFFDSDNNYMGSFISNRDDSKRKKFEVALKTSEENLKLANADKDKFFSILAHDIRSSFSGLIGLAQFLNNELDDLEKPKVKELVEKINYSVRSIFTFIENILEWSRIQSGRMEIKPKEFSLTDLIIEVIAINRAGLTKKNIKIEFDKSKEFNVFADENMISVVLRNLVSNALKFSYPGSIINMHLTKKDSIVEFGIKDEGTGIRETELDQLFKINSSIAKSGTENEQGTGIGLILSKEFIEKNGGKINAESEFGKGSLFTFTLPAVV